MEQKKLISEFERFISSKNSTSYSDKLAKQDAAIKADYDVLEKMNYSKREINEFLMEKYDIHSPSTIYISRRRAEEAEKQKSMEA